MNASTHSVGQGMAQGAAWMVLMRLVMRGASLINMMIMARLLVPEDFGLVAMAMIFVGAIDIFSEFNFDVALIKKQTAGRTDYDTAWTLSIIRGVVVAVLLLAIAGPAAELFDEPRLAPIIAALSVSPLLLGLQNIGVVDFRKSLDFRRDFLFMAGAKVAAVIVTICLAMLWRNYWALVGGIVGGNLWRVVASYAMHPHRPKGSLAGWRELFAFTKWLLLQNVLLYFRNRADRLVIGRVLGAATLGVYTLAYELANLVTSELIAPVRRALLPGFSMLSDEPARMRGMFVDVFALTLWIGAPIPIGIGLLAEPLVALLLGNSWAAAVPVIQMLVIAGFAALLSSGSQPVYLAYGRPEIQTLLVGLSAVLLLPAIIAGVALKGAIGAAIAVVVVQTLIALVDILIVTSLLQLDRKVIAAASWRSIVALGLMAAFVHAITRAWPTGGDVVGNALLLLSAMAAGGTVYLACSFVLWRLTGSDRGPESHVWHLIVGAVTALRTKFA
ncbi:MAG: lipopolysaccharide biosynthesis protein [Geminicoccaceae bacterium]